MSMQPAAPAQPSRSLEDVAQSLVEPVINYRIIGRKANITTQFDLRNLSDFDYRPLLYSRSETEAVETILNQKLEANFRDLFEESRLELFKITVKVGADHFATLTLRVLWKETP